MPTKISNCRVWRRQILLMAIGLMLLTIMAIGRANAAVVVIGHVNLPKMDDSTLQKVYTGKVIEIGGVGVVPVNVSSGNPLRNRFLQIYMHQDEEKFTAYWTVRRYIGKGVPPKEVPNSQEVINFVQSIPGGIGYVDETDLKPGLNLNILLRK